MNTRFHGVMSLGLVGIAVVIAAVTAFATSLLLGAAYLVICGVGGWVVISGFCVKCPCKVNCGHVLPGKLALALIRRRPGRYADNAAFELNLGQLLAVGLGMVGLPNVWLWQSPALLMVFWALLVIGIVQIRSFVCRACGNTFCPLNKVYRESAGQRGR